MILKILYNKWWNLYTISRQRSDWNELFQCIKLLSIYVPQPLKKIKTNFRTFTICRLSFYLDSASEHNVETLDECIALAWFWNQGM